MEKDTVFKIKREEGELIKAFKANNEAVLKTIYQENYNKVLTYVLQNKGTEQQAKDIYQEAFIALWKKIKNNQLTLTDSSSANGYLYTIAKNKWIDYLRSNKYKKMIPASKINGSVALHLEPEVLEEKMDEEEKLNKAMLAFNKLGNDCKLLLTKVYFEKKSMKEIGIELNLDVASARTKKYRCMQKLRQLAL